jgi:hypothetical protein
MTMQSQTLRAMDKMFSQTISAMVTLHTEPDSEQWAPRQSLTSPHSWCQDCARLQYLTEYSACPKA